MRQSLPPSEATKEADVVSVFEFGFSDHGGPDCDELEACSSPVGASCEDMELGDVGGPDDECLGLELDEDLLAELRRLYPTRPSDSARLRDMTDKEVGREGEVIAAAFLLSHEMDILETNWRCGGREADIVALDGSEVVLVEVKTRRKLGEDYPDEIPELAFDQRKLAGYRILAALYTSFHPEGRSIRFDVIAINLVVGGGVHIRHLVSAYAWDE